MVNSFLCFSTKYFENRLLTNDLIIVRNHRDDEKDERDIKRALERQGDVHIKVDIQPNSELQSLTSSPTKSLGPLQLQIHVQNAYDIRFGRSTYLQKEDEINFPMTIVPGPTKIGFNQSCQNNFNIQSPTHPVAVHINTDAQVTYDIQFSRSWTPWKGKEITFPIELVPCPNSSRINRNH
jgi:hypothetical protein